MIGRLFIDECLSPELVILAQEAGYEASCSRDRQLLGAKDWELLAVVVTGDFTLVTHNARDFRGQGSRDPGGLYAKQEVHAGLVYLSSFYGMDLERQKRLLSYALIKLAQREDLINTALEVFEGKDGKIRFETYDIPAPKS